MRSRRNARSASVYRRRRPIREPYDVVLIVCEGEKTEPYYLEKLRAFHKLSSVNVRIVPPPRTDPLGIVNFAINQLNKDPEYNRAYCVFDRDGHATYGAALRRVREATLCSAERLIAITSVPCFEIWLLLHYRYSAAPYTSSGGTSACDAVISELRDYFQDYTKANSAVFDALVDKVEDARRHAQRLKQHNEDTQSENPATDMHILVKYLGELKK
jgi:hypothetical protein